jgi:hypothetical protein
VSTSNVASAELLKLLRAHHHEKEKAPAALQPPRPLMTSTGTLARASIRKQQHNEIITRQPAAQ